MLNNKKGQINQFFTIVLVLLVFIIAAVFIGIGSGVITFTMDTINDVTTELGMAGSSNLSEYSDMTVGKANDFVQMFKWGSGILLIFGLLGILILASITRLNPNPFMIGLYLLVVVILVVTAIFMSNIYENFQDSGEDIGSELKTMPLTSFLIIYMPFIITVISFLGGIIIFSGIGEEFG